MGATGAESPWGRHSRDPQHPTHCPRLSGKQESTSCVGDSLHFHYRGLRQPHRHWQRCLCVLPPPSFSGVSNIMVTGGEGVSITVGSPTAVSGPLWQGRWEWGGCAWVRGEGMWDLSVPLARLRREPQVCLEESSLLNMQTRANCSYGMHRLPVCPRSP